MAPRKITAADEKLDGPFSTLRLQPGDEFTAQSQPDVALRLTAVAMPQRFAHFRYWINEPFGNPHPVACQLHALGGGWELLAKGMLTL